MIPVDSRWENYHVTGYVSKPSDARPSRSLQTFFVNDRPVRSKLLMSALEEAYRNQIMVGKFPACVLHLTLPATTVDVNVHPAKTEVKFLNEKSVFDCVHYGVLGALNKTPDRPQVQFSKPALSAEVAPGAGKGTPQSAPQTAPLKGEPAKKESFFRTMTAEEYKNFTTVIKDAPQPKPAAAIAAAAKVERTAVPPIREHVMLPQITPEEKPAPAPVQKIIPPIPEPEIEQVALEMPKEIPWRMVGELYNSYIIVEQGEEAFLIDKHAAHERILFEKLKANQEAISSQALLTPVPVRLSPEAAAELLANRRLLDELGFEIDEFGDNTILLRQIPMDLSPDDAGDAIETLASDLLNGRRENKNNIRDELLHTVACKAAIKAGWRTDDKELLALVDKVMSTEDLKYCPHGRPICVTLSKKQLEKQFKRS
jgi:DNA mismatch repair protein MutL